MPVEHGGHTRRFAQLLANQFTTSNDDTRLRIFGKLAQGTGGFGHRIKVREFEREITRNRHQSHTGEEASPKEEKVTIDHVKGMMCFNYR